MPSERTNLAVVVIQQALGNMFEVMERATAGIPGEDLNRLTAELQDTMLCLIAYLITVDGRYDPGEQTLVRQLIRFDDRPNAELEFLRKGTERWRQLECEVPNFFRVATKADQKKGTELARELMREIQLLANNCCITDERFAADEKRAIHRYLELLETHLEQETGENRTWLEP